MAKPLALIIEDDPEIGNIIFLSLKNDFEIQWITRSDEALTRLAQTIPMLIVLDLHLPGVSGRDLFLKIRTESRLDDTKIILCTADALGSVSLRDEADIVLLKPIKPSALRDLAKRLVKTS